jgi:hypothetical protein
MRLMQQVCTMSSAGLERRTAHSHHAHLGMKPPPANWLAPPKKLSMAGIQGSDARRKFKLGAALFARLSTVV